MSEELKIVIKAVTDSAKKEIGKVSSELEKVSGAAKNSSSSAAKAFGTIAKGAAAAVAAVGVALGAVVAIGKALVNLGRNTLEINKELAKLNATFIASGSTAEQATETYKNLYRFLGDSSKATEAAQSLALLTNNEKDLAEWTNILQGAYASMGDKLPIEGLAEAANETARVGTVTGVMADALNWAGVSEDAFNAQLAATNSLSEREALLRSTLNGIYGNAAEIYEQNNKALLDYNESQANSNIAMAAAGQSVLPLMTALNNLSATFMTALKPAIDAIVPPLASFVNMISKAIQSVMSFFGIVTGQASSIKTMASGVTNAANIMGSMASGADNLSSGLGSAAVAAEKVKRTTQGFDELNIVSSGSSGASGGGGSGGSGGGGSSAPGYAGGGMLDSMAFATEVEASEKKGFGFVEKIKEAFSGLKDVFAPSIEAWGGAWDTIKAKWDAGAGYIKSAFDTINTHILTDTIPSIINSFSVNLAPLTGDIVGFALVESGKSYEHFGKTLENVTNDTIIPAMDLVEQITTDTFGAIGSNWEEHGSGFLAELGTAFDNVRTHLDNLYMVLQPIIDTTITKVTELWNENLAPFVDELIDAVLDISTEITVFYNKVLAPIINWIITKIVPPIVDVVKSIINTTKELLGHITNSIGGIIQTIKGIIQFIVGVFTGDWKKAWDGIKNIFEGIGRTLGSIILTVQASFKGILDFIKVTFLSSWKIAWETVKGTFSAVWNWIVKAAKDAWNGIKNVFSGVGTFFGGMWNTIKSKFTDLGTKIGSAISNSVKSGINGVINMIESTINKGIGLINGAIGLINKLPGVNVSKINQLYLPRLAKGGVVDSATIAMIGERGKEAVLPLENNTSWMDLLVERLSARSTAPTKVVLMLKEKELGWATINAINGITEQTGGLQLSL